MSAVEAALAEETPSSNGWFQLAIPGDGSHVLIKKIVSHTGNGKAVENKDILKKLKSEKVIHGIDFDAIEGLLKLVQTNQIPNEPVSIANSDVEQGEDGNLDWCIDGLDVKESEVIVAPDMTIAVRRPGIKGKAGKNVFGKPKQPRPTFDPQLNAGTGIRFTEDNEGAFVYKSDFAGVLKYQEDTISIERNVIISEDQMQASMHIPVGKVPGASQPIMEQDILAVLVSLSITHGIHIDNIRAALSKQTDRPTLIKDVKIAEGKVAIDGVNARLVIDEQLAVGKLLKNGEIDFHEKSYPWNVKAGEIIGEVIPPHPEENGFTILGQELTAIPAEGANLRLEGISEDADGKLRAKQDGVLLTNGLSISVADHLVVNGDVCHRTGNVHSDKTVTIKGYVESGFIVESKGDVIIQDNVEQSLVRSNGNTIVKSGIRGSQSKVISRGNISASFIENARVKALGDIAIENSLVSSHTYCQGVLSIGNSNAKKSTIIGGTTYAFKGIAAANLGSEGCKKTEVCVGAKPEVIRILKNVREDITRIENEILKLEHLQAQHQQGSTQTHNGALLKIGMTCQAKKLQLKQLEIEQDKLQAHIKSSKSVKVEIYQNIYPDVCIHILDKIYEVKKKERAGIFFLEDELIIFRPAA